MDLLANIRVLLSQLDAELAVFTARLETTLHVVNQQAAAAGVAMPSAPVAPAPATPAAAKAATPPAPATHTVASDAAKVAAGAHVEHPVKK